MIISYAHRFIFFAVPKTGTHSVRRALRNHMDEGDLEQVGLFVQKKFSFPELKGIRHGHINARQIRAILGEETFTSFFKFAFVRNPYERFISYCAFMGRDGAFHANPQRFIRQVIAAARPPYELLFRPQSDFLVDPSGKLEMDYVGRTEEMQASYDHICARLGVSSEMLEHANASTHARYQDYYDPDVRQWVGSFYRRDLEMFDYRFDAHATEPA